MKNTEAFVMLNTHVSFIAKDNYWFSHYLQLLAGCPISTTEALNENTKSCKYLTTHTWPVEEETTFAIWVDDLISELKKCKRQTCLKLQTREKGGESNQNIFDRVVNKRDGITQILGIRVERGRGRRIHGRDANRMWWMKAGASKNNAGFARHETQ